MNRVIFRIRNRDYEIGDNIRVARSWKERSRGLLDDTSLKSNEGLWITPCGAVHTFFMKFTIDVVYLSRELRVLKICPSMRPWNMSWAPWRTASTLELAAGRVRELKLEVGDELETLEQSQNSANSI